MRNNHRTLTDVGVKAKAGAGRFAETERQNTEEVSQIPDA